MRHRSEEILEFWFGDLRRADASPEEYFKERLELWFAGTAEIDETIRRRFGADVERAEAGLLEDWKQEPRPCLAWVLLLDQFSLNIYRDQARSFENSERAIPASLLALDRHYCREVSLPERIFFYFPLEHSEKLEHQERSVELFKAALDDAPSAWKDPFESFHWYAVEHWRVVRDFGRFPDRNGILGRPSTPAEEKYLAEGGPPF